MLGHTARHCDTLWPTRCPAACAAHLPPLLLRTGTGTAQKRPASIPQAPDCQTGPRQEGPECGEQRAVCACGGPQRLDEADPKIPATLAACPLCGTHPSFPSPLLRGQCRSLSPHPVGAPLAHYTVTKAEGTSRWISDGKGPSEWSRGHQHTGRASRTV